MTGLGIPIGVPIPTRQVLEQDVIRTRPSVFLDHCSTRHIRTWWKTGPSGFALFLFFLILLLLWLGFSARYSLNDGLTFSLNEESRACRPTTTRYGLETGAARIPAQPLIVPGMEIALREKKKDKKKKKLSRPQAGRDGHQ